MPGPNCYLGIVGCTAMSTSGIAAVAGAAGPVIGGVLTGTLGWPSVFLVNVPLATVAVVLTVVAIPADTALLSVRGLIFAGAGLLAIMIMAFIVGLAQSDLPHHLRGSTTRHHRPRTPGRSHRRRVRTTPRRSSRRRGHRIEPKLFDPLLSPI